MSISSSNSISVDADYELEGRLSFVYLLKNWNRILFYLNQPLFFVVKQRTNCWLSSVGIFVVLSIEQSEVARRLRCFLIWIILYIQRTWLEGTCNWIHPKRNFDLQQRITYFSFSFTDRLADAIFVVVWWNRPRNSDIFLCRSSLDPGTESYNVQF